MDNINESGRIEPFGDAQPASSAADRDLLKDLRAQCRWAAMPPQVRDALHEFIDGGEPA